MVGASLEQKARDAHSEQGKCLVCCFIKAITARSVTLNVL